MTGTDSSGPPAASIGPFVTDAVAFREALRERVEGQQGGPGRLAVLVIDCGVIGRIDAAWGYRVGDAVRDRIGTLLCSDVLRPGDFVGAMGRDDFACALAAIEDPAVALLAAKKSLRALNVPFWIGDDEIFANPAIGIAISPSSGDQAEILLQRAKSACALARDRPGRIADYAEEDPGNSEAAKLLYENRLRTAVAEDSLELVFQPQYDLRLGQIMGAEGLLRWRDPALGIIDAVQLFAAADAADRVTNLVSSILNRALRNVSEFRYSAGLDLRIGIKLPARALQHPDILEVIQRALATWSRRPGTLILGIGETSLLGTESVPRETLVRLKELGVKLSIDDPAITISSLFGLATMPFQEIRIDVSAARDLAAAPRSEHILRALSGMAHQLKLDVLAVGVADDATAARLKELGCDYMQAEYKGPALAAKQFVERFGFNEG